MRIFLIAIGFIAIMFPFARSLHWGGVDGVIQGIGLVIFLLILETNKK
jgi:hypothetical protein